MRGRRGVLGEDALTQNPGTTEDNYAIQNNYWNSVTSSPNGAIGYSTGNSCIKYDYNDGAIGKFVITYPANPSEAAPVGNSPNGSQVDEQAVWASQWPNYFPWYGNAPYSLSITNGGPTGYVSSWKGCSWDENSCTPGSSVLPKTGYPKLGDINSFPQVLSTVSSIPTNWSIDASTDYGDPFNTDGEHIWDASYDIWFDKNAQTGSYGTSTTNGQAPYGNVRGQNDGLEIMVWMNCKHCYVGNTVNGQYAQPNGTGWAQPSGATRSVSARE